jgi:7-cyano-7-deazaguanine synthase in queuosine biosynthesis
MRVGHVNWRDNADGSESVWAELRHGDYRQEIRFRVRGASATTGADPFVPAALLPAMRAGSALEIEDSVSPMLLAATPKVQEVVTGWYDSFSKVPFLASTTRAATAAPGVGCFFSGGLDSFYSVLQHQEEITHLILVHGFDMELRAVRRREQTADVLRRAAAELGKPLIEVETNLRAFADRYVRWGADYHGAALCSVALLLSRVLGKVYLAASYNEALSVQIPAGSHPHLDPLWSTEATQIIFDGMESGRPQKAARIAESDVALRSLRVCWENRGRTYNCGRCEKCLRTMVNLRIAGALDRCPTFDRPLDLRAVARVVCTDEYERLLVEDNLLACQAAGNDPELEQALQQCLAWRPSKLQAAMAKGDLRRRAVRKLRRSLGMPTHNWDFVATTGR